MQAAAQPRVAVVIPCYRVSRQIAAVIARIGPECSAIYAIDDACPEQSGAAIERVCADPRVRVIRHEANQGVGGAMITGFRAALADGADIVVKLDGDGQMDPELIPGFIAPIARGQADYVKGNRFFSPEDARSMPRTRLLGNLALTFMTKLSSGYWSLFDPNNGYVAIDARVLAHVPLDKVARRYFFESDMLFRLNTLRARVIDLPMEAVYGDEESSLSPMKMVPHFFGRHVTNTFKRISYSYFLRDFSIASIELVAGTLLMAFGLVFGSYTWIANLQSGTVTPTGTVMLAALPVLMGLQFLLAFIGHDIASAPRDTVGPLLSGRRRKAAAQR
ncbi:glycosyl transferase family 2 [Novosphingobium sp. TH158]|nr:glycosyl transferase family 2 [Novosphingobium sp. TH158]